MNEDEIAATFSFLAVDENAARQSGLVRKHRSKSERLDSHSNKVFVWGLNDSGQLGSSIGETKVCTCIQLIYNLGHPKYLKKHTTIEA